MTTRPPILPDLICRVCGREIPRKFGKIGRPPVTCSPRCRKQHNQTYQQQQQLRERQLQDRIRQLELEIARLHGERSRCICTPILVPFVNDDTEGAENADTH